MTVITNNHVRPLVTYWAVPEKERHWFDYVEEDERWSDRFFSYRGRWYDVGDFPRVEPGGDLAAAGWHGADADSFWTGMVVRLVDADDGPSVVVGRWSE